jgi:hypothetical protein
VDTAVVCGTVYDGANNPGAWFRASTVDIADRLAGRLLLSHGENGPHTSRVLPGSVAVVGLSPAIMIGAAPAAPANS